MPWQPANEVETRMLAALEKDDRAAFFTILMAAPLYLPQSVADPTTTTEASADDYVTFVSGDVTYLLVFTSLEGLQAGVGDAANGYVESNFDTLRAGLAGTDVRLGFNLGAPIDAWVDIESMVRAAAGEIAVPTGLEMTQLLQITDPANADKVEELAQEEIDDYVDEYINGLINGDVLVVARNGRLEVTPAEHGPTVVMYSDADFVPEGTATQSMSFLQLVAAWPTDADVLAVNPGTPLEFSLPAEALTPFAQSLETMPDAG